MAVMCGFTHKVLCHILWVHQVYLRLFLLLCSLSELGWPIQLILQITFASKYQFCWRSFFSLWPYAVWSSGTNQPLCLTGLCTVFKLSSDQFRPPREVLTSSEKSFKNRQWWESRFSLPSDSSQTPIPMDIEDERKKTEEMMKKEMILLSFLPPPPPSTQSASFPSLSSFPHWNFHLYLAASLYGQSWRWKRSNLLRNNRLIKHL